MKDAFVAGACRTAIGNYGGSLKDTGAVQLGSIVIRETLERTGFAPDHIDEVIMGCVLQGGLGQNVARQASIAAGLPVAVASHTVNKVCGSGLKSVILAAQGIRLGDINAAVAGGTENMSAAPYLLEGGRWGFRMGNQKVVDLMIRDGLWCGLGDEHMGCTAERLAERYELSREAQDTFAASSQNKAEAAIESGAFRDEIVAVEIPQRKGDPVVFDTDEFPRFGTTADKLAKLRPAFAKDGTVTAGNASGINDGASAMLVASEDELKEFDIEPMGRIAGYGSIGLEPGVMGLGPVEAVRKALMMAGWNTGGVDLWELNEAFAAQSLAVLKELNIDPDIVNVNGGALALGHPIGASGARVLTTLLHEMKRRDVHAGVAALCIGGGQGIAVAIERL